MNFYLFKLKVPSGINDNICYVGTSEYNSLKKFFDRG